MYRCNSLPPFHTLTFNEFLHSIFPYKYGITEPLLKTIKPCSKRLLIEFLTMIQFVYQYLKNYASVKIFHIKYLNISNPLIFSPVNKLRYAVPYFVCPKFYADDLIFL